MEDQTYNVKLYIYDVTKGMARTLSPMLLGKQLEGVWHTSIVIHGLEYFFGSNGIAHCPPVWPIFLPRCGSINKYLDIEGGTLLGEPTAIVDLGNTEVNSDIFKEYISSLGESAYRGERYNLFEHNCNSFSNEVAQFLTGRKIPSYVTDLPSEVLDTPLGQALRPLIDSYTTTTFGNNTNNGPYGQR